MQNTKSIAFFGCACGEPGDEHYDSAFEVAKLVATSGRRIVNGGGPGVMLAATQGAKAGNGETTAVYYRPELATMFKGEVAENYADETFEEANYILRTKKLLELGNAYIVFNGGTGTISEFAMAWGLARLYFGHHRPLILYGDFWEGVTEAFKKNMLVRPEEYEVFTITKTPEEAMAAIEKYESVLEKNHHEHANCANSECYFLM